MNIPNPHRKGIDILIESIQQRNRLDDVIVILLHRELYLRPRISVTQTELCAVHITLLQLLKQLRAMKPQTTKQVLDNLIRLAVDASERSLDGTSQVFVGDTKDDPLFLAALGKIDFEERFQMVARDPLRDVIRIFKRLRCTSNCFSAIAFNGREVFVFFLKKKKKPSNGYPRTIR